MTISKETDMVFASHFFHFPKPGEIHRQVQGRQGPRTPLFELSYRLVKSVVTEYFQFRPCHFSVYDVL